MKTAKLVSVFALINFSVMTSAHAECTCKYKERDIPEGTTICMQTPNGAQMAKCEKVLNNTSWKFTNAVCPTANSQGVKNYSVAILEFDKLKVVNHLSWQKM